MECDSIQQVAMFCGTMIFGAVKSSSDSQRGRCASASARRRERNNQSVVIECQVAGSQHLELPNLWSDSSALTCLWCAFTMVKCSDVRLCFCFVVRPENAIAIGQLMEFRWLGRDCSQNLCTTREFARAGTLYRCQKNAVDLNSSLGLRVLRIAARTASAPC